MTIDQLKQLATDYVNDEHGANTATVFSALMFGSPKSDPLVDSDALEARTAGLGDVDIPGRLAYDLVLTEAKAGVAKLIFKQKPDGTPEDQLAASVIFNEACRRPPPAPPAY